MSYYKTLKLLGYAATEIIGKYNKETNKTEATCIFILDKQTANEVKNLTPQRPGKFNLMSGEIKESVNIW